MTLTFDGASHTYKWYGTPVPNVTRILSPLVDYSMVPADKLEVARQKGVAVHKMVELYLLGDLDEDTLPEWMRPILEKFQAFQRDTGFEMFESEYRVFHPTYRYAGTLDLFGTIQGTPSFIDIKRSLMAGAVIGLQLAAYHEAYCAQENVGKRASRYALRLHENEPYKLEPFADKNDFNVFLSLLSIHNWKEKHL